MRNSCRSRASRPGISRVYCPTSALHVHPSPTGGGRRCLSPTGRQRSVFISTITQTGSRAPILTVEITLPDIEELRQLVAEGQDKGYLTFDEVAGALEEIELTKEQLEDFYTYLLDHNIELLDGESKQQAQQDRLIHGEKPPELDLTVEPSLDSLRLYLREIGKVPLLTADQEVS